MKCPPAVQRVLAEIIRIGILRTRAAGWSEDAERCAVEADHIHNLPRLLTDYRPEAVKYYWDAERPAFIAHSPDSAIRDFEALWDELRERAGLEKQSAASG